MFQKFECNPTLLGGILKKSHTSWKFFLIPGEIFEDSKKNFVFLQTDFLRVTPPANVSSTVIAEFCVNMTCKGTKDGTAVMLIQINITSEERQLALNLRRIKSCIKGIFDILR